jgi:Protein of unknown function (DUF3035)
MMRSGLGGARAGGAVVAMALLALSACAPGEPKLMNVRSSTNGPDEFAIVPPKPLEMPETLAQLPPPTPGGFNRTDVTPNEDAIIALGGRPGGLGIPAGDGPLIAYASRRGVAGNIRTLLAQEDLAYRTDNNGRVLERLFNVNVYFRAYEPYALDQHAELERWRAVGAGNPSAPPPLEGE